jgi:glycosyltransferase involved in cell wall biosynthesis
MSPNVSRPLHRALYGSARVGLRVCELTAGRANRHVGGVCAYLGSLIDDGRYAELGALLRHGLKKLAMRRAQVGGRRRRRLQPHAISIDARTEVLALDGTLRRKATIGFPSREAPVLASIVITCHNYGRYVMEAVESALAQTLASREVIVVDDGSTDPHTRDVVAALSRRTDIRVIQQANQGLPAARNNGIAVARGEYVCCLDADDLLMPTYLECAIALMEADRSIGFAYSHVELFGDVNEIWHTRDFDPETALLGNLTSVSAVFRRDDWQESRGYTPAMKGGFEDWEYWLRLASLGRRGAAIERPLLRHRRHGRTMTHDAKDMQEELHRRIALLNPAFFADRRLRRRLSKLKGPAAPPRAFEKLAEPGAYDAPALPTLLVVVRWLRRGGAEILLLEILAALKSAWHIVVVTTDPDPHEMSAEFRDLTPEVYHLAEWLEPQHRVDILVHLVATRGVRAMLTSGSVWVLNLLAELRAEFPELGVALLLHNHGADGPFRAALRNERHIDRFIAVSSKITTALRSQRIAAAKVADIPNGIDTEAAFNPQRIDRAAVRRTLGISPDQVVLIWVGRLSEEKRPLAFLDIVASLAKQVDVKGLIIGDGPMAEAVTERIAADRFGERVRFIGRVSRQATAQFYAMADILVLTSSIEGMPLAVLEALAMGCSVAATNVGDVARVVRPGENGFLVDPETPSLIADCILANRDGLQAPDRRCRISRDFRRREFAQVRMTSEYVKLFASFLQGG